jgi:hypothetical protein
MNNAVETAQVPSFIKTSSGVVKLIEKGEGFTNTQTGRRSHKPILRK